VLRRSQLALLHLQRLHTLQGWLAEQCWRCAAGNQALSQTVGRCSKCVCACAEQPARPAPALLLGPAHQRESGHAHRSSDLQPGKRPLWLRASFQIARSSVGALRPQPHNSLGTNSLFENQGRKGLWSSSEEGVSSHRLAFIFSRQHRAGLGVRDHHGGPTAGLYCQHAPADTMPARGSPLASTA